MKKKQSKYFYFMFIYLFTIACITSIISCNNQVPTTYTNELKTGWYHVIDSTTGIKKELADADTSYYLNPEPVVTVHNFASIVVEQLVSGGDAPWELIVHLDDEGTEAFKIATANSIKRDMAFVVDNELFQVIRIQMAIPTGICSLGKRDFTQSDAEDLMAKIKAEQ